MKQTQFAKYLTYFMIKYLVGERGCSRNTVAAYRDAISLFIVYMRDVHSISVERLDFKDILRDRNITFLEWLEVERHCGISTRNARLAALHAFIRFLIYKCPDYMEEWQRMLAIKSKRSPKASVVYLSDEGMKLLLSQPDTSTSKGRRDLTLLSLMYDCAGRVQEIADLVPAVINFGKPTLLRIIGKGNKTRLVPISEQATASLRIYMQENGLLNNGANEYPLFNNGRGNKLTRMAITAILKKYCNAARKINQALIPINVSPHSLRHSKAMMLQQNGVNLICIRDFLGHESVTTTEIYARIDNRQKRKAIDKTSLSVGLSEEPSWQKDKNLLSWLENLGE